jgi:hypothetical protein
MCISLGRKSHRDTRQHGTVVHGRRVNVKLEMSFRTCEEDETLLHRTTMTSLTIEMVK